MLSLRKHETNCQIVCDISKAFDRVWHRGLLLKLENYGINGNTYCGSKTTLKIEVKKSINENFSSQKSISAGFPQGSVLGPLLFSIYINNILKDLNGLARLFADDTSLSCSSLDLHQIEMIINDDLRKLSVWAKKWLIVFNPLKTEVMLISNTFCDYNI